MTRLAKIISVVSVAGGLVLTFLDCNPLWMLVGLFVWFYVMMIDLSFQDDSMGEW
jgi:hypothetical protein